MYLSCLDLDPRPYSRGSSSGWRIPIAFISGSSLAFDDNPGRILFRLERPESHGYWCSHREYPIGLALQRFPPMCSRTNLASSRLSQSCRRAKSCVSCLRANPTVKREGHRHGLFREEDQLQWFARKGQTGGFVP